MADSPKPRRNDPNTEYGKYLGMGMQTAIGAGLGYAVGTWLDKRYHWAPWGVTIGMFLGVAAGMYLLIKEAIRINRN